MKKIIKPLQLRKILGDWHVVDLSNDETKKIWEALKDRKPYKEILSSHMAETRYRYQKKIYHVFWELSDHPTPSLIGVRESYNWDNVKS